MRAHGVAALAVVASLSPAGADPAPLKVDVKPFRDELIVLQDGDKNLYVVKPLIRATTNATSIEARIFFGKPGGPLYEQVNIGRSADGAAWSQSMWAPRVAGMRGSMLMFKDSAYQVWCDKDPKPLTQLTGDKAKAIVDRGAFLTEYNVHRAHMLARDEAGVYYYVDKLSHRYGGKGFRVFVGKKGAMKQLALTDVASDTAGDVFSTKTGDLRLTRTQSETSGKHSIAWIKGEKRVELIPLDPEPNAAVVWSDLGVYKFLGTICDNF